MRHTSEVGLFQHPNGPLQRVEQTPLKRSGGHFNRLLNYLDIKWAKITKPNGMLWLEVWPVQLFWRGAGGPARVGADAFASSVHVYVLS